MNGKSKIFGFTFIIISSLTSVNPAIAGWANFADDALEALAKFSRKYGDDVLRNADQVSKPLADDVVSGTVRLTRQPMFDPQTGNIIAPLLVGGAAGYAAGQLVVNCNNQTAYWVNSESQYQNVDFNAFRSYFCRY